MKTRYVVGACALTLIAGAGIGHTLMPRDLATTPPVSRLTACLTEDDPGPCHWDAKTQGNGKGQSFDAAPYCMVDRDTAGDGYVTVAGPPDGWITAGTRPAGQLVMVEGQYADEVAPDAEPYGGIRYNVRVKHPQQPITVDGIVCETT